MTGQSAITDARNQAKWWVGGYGILGSSALVSLSIFGVQDLAPWSKVVYLLLALLGYVVAAELLISTRRLYPRARGWEELTGEEKERGVKRFDMSLRDLAALERDTHSRERAQTVKAAVVHETRDSEVLRAFSEITPRLRRFSLVIVSVIAVGYLLPLVPGASIDDCASSPEECQTFNVGTRPVPVTIHLLESFDAGDSQAARDVGEVLREAGCPTSGELAALAVGGTYAEPVVQILDSCQTGPILLPRNIAFIVPQQ